MSKTDLLTAEELAGRLHVRPSTVREWARRGKIPTVRLSPKVVRYSVAAVIQTVSNARRGGKGTTSQTTHWERLTKWALNNWLVVAFLAILAVVVSLVALGSGLETLFNWMWRFIAWLWP